MFREVIPFDIVGGLTQWALTFLAILGVVIGISLLITLIQHGMGFWSAYVRRFREVCTDLIAISPRRIGAVALVTIKESVRRKALLVFVVFAIVFMFANWFLGSDEELSAAKPYVSTVLMALNWMIIPVALLLSCWGLPADIKDRSLHTVVTKPVRRSEVLLGRMIGYSTVSLAMLAAMGVVGYIWIIRSVPETARNQLIGRVPHYGTLTYLDRSGVEGQGINVGDIWTYRSFVSGGTKSCGIYTFENIDVDAIREAGVMRLEYKWEAFRTYKGDIETPVQFRIYLINPDPDNPNPLTVRVSTKDFQIQEFATDTEAAVIEIPIDGIPPREGAEGAFYVTSGDLSVAGGQFDPQRLNLIDDLIHDGSLIVRVYCVDAQQHIGMARHDFFIRMPDRSFAVSYAKSLLNSALMVILIVVLGTTASCFLKGPVATILTLSLIILGQGLRGMMDDLLRQFYTEEKILGGGPLESAYRLYYQMNQQTDLPENLGTEFIQTADQGIMHTVGLTRNIFPNFNHFDTREFLANGFDVPFDASVLAALAVTLSFMIPCYIIGYVSLRFRELETK